MAVLVFLLLVLANVGVQTQEAYQLRSNASITHYEIAYLVMFAVPLMGRAALRRRLPLWLKLTSIAGGISTLFCLLISAYPFVNVVDAHALRYQDRRHGAGEQFCCAGVLLDAEEIPHPSAHCG
jgi:glutamate:GABA antiporter